MELIARALLRMKIVVEMDRQLIYVFKLVSVVAGEVAGRDAGFPDVINGRWVYHAVHQI